MKKKLIAALTATALVLGVGTLTLASSENDVLDGVNFKEMLPFMQKMHPDLDEKQLEEMFDRCHGEDGMMNGEMGGMMKGNSEGMQNHMKKMMNAQDGTKL